jgi:hypothetical protein
MFVGSGGVSEEFGETDVKAMLFVPRGLSGEFVIKAEVFGT